MHVNRQCRRADEIEIAGKAPPRSRSICKRLWRGEIATNYPDRPVAGSASDGSCPEKPNPRRPPATPGSNCSLAESSLSSGSGRWSPDNSRWQVAGLQTEAQRAPGSPLWQRCSPPERRLPALPRGSTRTLASAQNSSALSLSLQPREMLLEILDEIGFSEHLVARGVRRIQGVLATGSPDLSSGALSAAIGDHCRVLPGRSPTSPRPRSSHRTRTTPRP